MYYDLNIPWPARPQAGSSSSSSSNSAKKQKGKQRESNTNVNTHEPVKRGAETLSENDRRELEKCVQMAIKRESS